MSETVRPQRGYRWVWPTVTAFIAYFAILLVPKVFPSVGGSGYFTVFALSVPLTLLVLISTASVSGLSLLYTWLRKRPSQQRQIKVASVGCLGLAVFLLVFALARVLPSKLPTGSYLQRFDRTVWLDPHSADYVKDDISPRQKMLADVIATLPGRSRKEIAEMLGPSFDTAHFKSTGWDLIYVLGFERDSFMALDSEWLLIWLDNDGRFERYTITND